MTNHSEEIAQRLREEHRFRFGFHEDGGEAPSLYTDAADLIEAQHAENERLRAALRAAGLAPNVVDAIAEGEPPRPCPAGHGDQCCGYPAACEASLTGSSEETTDG